MIVQVGHVRRCGREEVFAAQQRPVQISTHRCVEVVEIEINGLT